MESASRGRLRRPAGAKPDHAQSASAKPKAKRAQAERLAATKVSTSMLSFRMDPATRDLVDRAAAATGQNRTDFMVTTLRERAIEVLLNQRLFALNHSDFAAFTARLEEPPPPNAKLKALLSRKPVWDRP